MALQASLNKKRLAAGVIFLVGVTALIPAIIMDRSRPIRSWLEFVWLVCFLASMYFLVHSEN